MVWKPDVSSESGDDDGSGGSDGFLALRPRLTGNCEREDPLVIGRFALPLVMGDIFKCEWFFRSLFPFLLHHEDIDLHLDAGDEETLKLQHYDDEGSDGSEGFLELRRAAKAGYARDPWNKSPGMHYGCCGHHCECCRSLSSEDTDGCAECDNGWWLTTLNTRIRQAVAEHSDKYPGHWVSMHSERLTVARTT